eukprot:1160507-Pelagomonas_calceolata.AAC.4
MPHATATKRQVSHIPTTHCAGGAEGLNTASLLDRIFESICRPLRVRVEQVRVCGVVDESTGCVCVYVCVRVCVLIGHAQRSAVLGVPDFGKVCTISSGARDPLWFMCPVIHVPCGSCALAVHVPFSFRAHSCIVSLPDACKRGAASSSNEIARLLWHCNCIACPYEIRLAPM